MENRERLDRKDHAKIDKAAEYAKKGGAAFVGLLGIGYAGLKKVPWQKLAETTVKVASKAAETVQKIR